MAALSEKCVKLSSDERAELQEQLSSVSVVIYFIFLSSVCVV